jgi:hypothetical protein
MVAVTQRPQGSSAFRRLKRLGSFGWGWPALLPVGLRAGYFEGGGFALSLTSSSNQPAFQRTLTLTTASPGQQAFQPNVLI